MFGNNEDRVQLILIKNELCNYVDILWEVLSGEKWSVFFFSVYRSFHLIWSGRGLKIGGD